MRHSGILYEVKRATTGKPYPLSQKISSIGKESKFELDYSIINFLQGLEHYNRLKSNDAGVLEKAKRELETVKNKPAIFTYQFQLPENTENVQPNPEEFT